MGRGASTEQPATATRRAAARKVELSAPERSQLGSLRLRRDGTPSAHPYPPADLWPSLRRYLVDRSRHFNPRLDAQLTAYTPGETLALLDHPTISAWHRGPAVERLPDRYRRIVLVPCAKTKPWTGDAVKRSKLYSAYNQLAAEFPDHCFVTISEPLGIVPMSYWADFPQYDNPGLFRDDAQQSGMTKRQWEASPFGRWYGLPFDELARARSIDRLGAVIGRFLAVHEDREIVSLVDNHSGPKATHSEMLDVAIAQSGATLTRHPKRAQAHVSPLPYLRNVLGA